MASFGLTLANRGVIIGAVTVPELFDMAKRGEDSGAFSAVWVGDSLLAKPRLESIALLSALAAITKKVKLAVGCMATFPQRHPALLAQQWASLDVISGGRSWLAVCLGGPNEQSPAQALEHKVMGIKDTERVGRLEEGIVYFNQGKVDLKNYLGPAENGKKPAASVKPIETVDELTGKISALLEKSHCFFADLLEKLPKAEYKSIASAVARLYEEQKISQDKDGKFELKVEVN